MKPWRYLLYTCVACLGVGCPSVPPRIDKSSDAFASKDLTLLSSCVSSPGASLALASGVDSCHFTVGDLIDGSWTLVVPPPGPSKFVTGGTVDVYFKGTHKSYPILSWTTQVPFADLFGGGNWTADKDETVVEALATVNWTDEQGLNQVTLYRGVAVLIVTAAGYDRMPFGSGNALWGATCRVELSSAGRSAVVCK